jgi:hypothetical protein
MRRQHCHPLLRQMEIMRAARRSDRASYTRDGGARREALTAYNAIGLLPCRSKCAFGWRAMSSF